MVLRSSDGEIAAQLEEGVALWTIQRPSRHNSLARATLQRLWELVAAAQENPAVRVVVLCGEGGTTFCAGADLKERVDMSLDQVREMLALFRRAFAGLDALDKPVIAAMNGSAFGGGLELALACDLRVLQSDAFVGLTETRLGIIPGAGGTQRLSRTVGVARAKQMILLAERLSASEALRIGLVHRVAAPGEDTLSLALEWAELLARGAPIALAAALYALDAAWHSELAEGLDIERACYERTLVSADRNEGLAAFLDKRTPQFRGE